MAQIQPFQGALYSRRLANEISLLVAPPYDVISPEYRSKLSRQSRYNVVRLDLPQRFPNDVSGEIKYKRAADIFNAWLDEGILELDPEPAVYIYSQEYEIKGERKTRLGFIALAKIEDFGRGNIKAHECTLAEPKADRLNLLKTTRANFSQVFGLYPDQNGEADSLLKRKTREKPRVAIEYEGVIHRLWSVSDKDFIDRLTASLDDKTIFIADGHHRYETALNYRDEMRRLTGDTSGKAPFDYVMMMLVSMNSDGLTVLPTHRAMTNLPKINKDKLLNNIGQLFEVRSFDSLEDISASMASSSSTSAIGMYLGNGRFHLLEHKDSKTINGLLENHHPSIRHLDVTVLHCVIINRILGVEGTNIENSFAFSVDETEIVRLVDTGRHQIGFFLRSTDIEDIKAVAEAGKTMPQKSTYFYPKLLTGLVFYKH